LARLGQGALLAVASAALVVLLLESGTRALGLHFPAIARPEVPDGGLWVYDRTKGWFHAPGSRGRAFLGGPDAGLVRINALGLRGAEIPRSRPPGLRRVLALGDSYVFGVGVDEEHVFTTRLAQRLARGGARVEVCNAGVSGYSTDQQLILLQELGPRLAPDVVVLVMCDNDFEGNGENFSYQQYYKPYYEQAPGGTLLLRQVPVPRLDAAQRLKLWLGRRSNLWNFARSRRAAWPPLQRALERLEVDVAQAPPGDLVALTAALVVAVRDEAGRLGAGFVTLNTARRRENTRLFQALRPRLKQAGVDYLGLEGPLGRGRERHPERPWDFADDPHWNLAAHRLAAEVVAQRLEQTQAERLR
jgi:hypothetical protein